MKGPGFGNDFLQRSQHLFGMSSRGYCVRKESQHRFPGGQLSGPPFVAGFIFGDEYLSYRNWSRAGATAKALGPLSSLQPIPGDSHLQVFRKRMNPATLIKDSIFVGAISCAVADQVCYQRRLSRLTAPTDYDRLPFPGNHAGVHKHSITRKVRNEEPEIGFKSVENFFDVDRARQ